MMRRGASLDTNQARRQLLEERKNIATLQLTADHHLASSINAVDLEDRLGNVETDCRNRLHSWLLRIVGASTAPKSMALQQTYPKLVGATAMGPEWPLAAIGKI